MSIIDKLTKVVAKELWTEKPKKYSGRVFAGGPLTQSLVEIYPNGCPHCGWDAIIDVTNHSDNERRFTCWHCAWKSNEDLTPPKKIQPINKDNCSYCGNRLNLTKYGACESCGGPA